MDQTLPKQLVLYMSKEDEETFLQYLRSLGDLVILPATSPSSDFAPISVLAEQGCSSPGGNGVRVGEELLRDRWIPVSSRRVSPFMDRISNDVGRWNPS